MTPKPMDKSMQEGMDAYLERAQKYNKLMNIKGAGLTGTRQKLKKKKVGVARRLKEAKRQKIALNNTLNKVNFAPSNNSNNSNNK